MRLSRIHIKNFKGFRDVSFEPESFTCLVGENNAGKSTILQAITTALSRPKHLDEANFHDENLAVEFEVSFDGVGPKHLERLDEKHRTKIAPLIFEERLRLLIRYPKGEPVKVSTFAARPKEPTLRVEHIEAVFKGKRGKAVSDALENEFPTFAGDAPSDLSATTAREYLQQRIRETLAPTEFEQVVTDLPTGIPAAITKLLPEAIYIPAVKDLRDELKTSQSTPFGRLLGLLLDDMEPDLDKISEMFRELDGMLNRVPTNEGEVDQRHQRVRALETSIEGFLREHFPSASLRLLIPPPDLKVVLNNAQIYIDDGSVDLIENKGDGIKRSLTFALLRSYVEHLAVSRAADRSDTEEDTSPLPQPLLFLFEEPELFLHPRSQRVLFSALTAISQSHQVVVTTHSPIFFEPGITAAFVRVSKDTSAPKPKGQLHPVNLVLDREKAETFRLAKFENSEAAFFSKAVVLFEGESDDAFCRHVAKALNPDWDFEQANIALVKVSGKGNFTKFRNFFEAFGLKVFVIADLDAMFAGYEHLGAPNNAATVRTSAIQTIDARIDAQGIKAEPSTRQIKGKLNTGSWRNRYDQAREIIKSVQRGEALTSEKVETLESLFVWEQEIARVKACREDDEARAALVTILDTIRPAGVVVLSKGAIEDYYPAGAPTHGSKPSRALAACDLVTNERTAKDLSEPLEPGRAPELVEIFEAVFDFVNA